jgi:AcrR family transcriptional regulator
VTRAAKKSFKQPRAAATYQALLDAAEEVFAERGFDGAQTPQIAERAGVSTGALYRYFPDKRALFLEMIARDLERAHADVMAGLDPARFTPGDARAIIDAAVGVLFDHIRRSPALGRVYLSMSLSDPEVARLRSTFERRSLHALTDVLAAVVPREVVPDPQAAALVIHLAGVEAAQHEAGLRPRIAKVKVRDALVEMLTRYLFPKS